MNRIIEILMRRDEMTLSEATALVDEVREIILDSEPFEADEILMDELGLEPDCLIDLLS